jgi:stage II sporulation protein D
MSRTTRLLALSVVAALATPLPAYAGAPDSHDNRVSERRAVTVKLDGRGYGHGRGMSQWGAHDAAEKGLSYQRILRFYYPRTKLGRKGGTLQVRITDDTTRDVIVLDRDGLTVKALSTGRTWKPRVAAKRWRIQPTSGDSVVSYQSGGDWHRWKAFAGRGEFSAGKKPLTLVLPGDKVAYRGKLRSASAVVEGVTRDVTVNVVSLDDYVKGVVPQEVPAEWPAHAVRAQAVAARTYAAFLRKDGAQPICDTTSCQVYGGYTAEHPASNAAVRATRRKVLLFRGSPAFTEFSASNGGWTAQGQVHGKNVRYLPAKKDPYDHAYRHWTEQLTAAQVHNAWPVIGDLEGVRVTKRDGHGTWNGRAITVNLLGSNADQVVSGAEFMSRMGLMSTWFAKPAVSN